MQDPIMLAEAIKRNFALHFFGEYKAKFESIERRLQVPAADIDRRDELLKMRGPFLQALSIPTWSERKWPEFAGQVRGAFAPNGMHAAVSEGMAAAGIQRLQRFQEQAIARIVDDKDTLVVAGTGRGKSESWLIPIFQYIVREKLAGNVKGTKALLIYPTKALAQDQFRRIISYLTQINARIPGTPITIGIYDGDTPYKGDRTLESFLSKSFRFMDCPRMGTKDLCKVCINTAVQVETQGSRTRLTVAERECQPEVRLDFIHLTREDIVDAEVDILITNPDIINYQLINVNNASTRKVFVEQPRFIVLDEVHIYNGLFGAFTAMLMRRLRQVRKSLGVQEPLRFIAASATVQNKADIFRRLCAVTDPDALVEEERAELPGGTGGIVPPTLMAEPLDEELLLEVWRGQAHPVYEQALQELGLTRPGAVSVLAPRVTLGEQLLDKLTRQPDDRLAFLSDIYRHMRAESLTPRGLLEWLQSHYGLTPAAADNLLGNFTMLGGIAGILERRAHVFAWALDGYYGCAACGKVYASPVSTCDCGNHFVSRFAFCTHCGEEVLEVWACPKCLHAYPMVASRDGESLFFDPPVCTCAGADHKGTVTVRAMVHADRECRQCHTVYSASEKNVCPVCEAWTVEQGEAAACTNPECDWTGPLPDHRCPSCASTEAAIVGYAGMRCETCGSLSETGNCCGHPGLVAMRVPWLCGECGTAHYTPEPPALCTCGKSKFHWGALLDVPRVVRQDDHDYMPGRTAIPGPAAEVSFDNFKVMARDGSLVNVSDAGRGLMPCHHPYTRWNKKRFHTMVRTPENILATSSQILLRTLLRDTDRPLAKRLMDAKMLTFSDSHRDMESVNRNFNEPERRHFLAAMAFQVLQRRGSLTLGELVAETLEGVELYGAEIYSSQHATNIYRDLTTVKAGVGLRKRLVREDVERLVRPRGPRDRAALVLDGIVDLKLNQAALNRLGSAERKLLGQFWEMQGRRARSVYNQKTWSPAEVSLLRSLEAKGLLVQEEERLYIAPQILQVSLIGPAEPGLWAPRSNAFHATLDIQLERRSTKDLVRYQVPFAERANPASRFFSLAVYELVYSPAALLASRVYKGDTKKEERRETEHIFKAKPFLNHISSGPAMEVGIDVGNLNALALYGTPPNINGYLQRVGRAGRRSKRSLVLTVSKSNPIDFYYYRWPLKLIDSAPQPVPLTDQNREVLKISLTWAVLDYIACHYSVPWISTEVAAAGERRKIIKTDGMHQPLSMPRGDAYERFTKLLNTEVDRLDMGETLNALSHVLSTDQVQLREWLRDLVAELLPPGELDGTIEQVLSEFAGNTYGFVKEVFAEIVLRLRGVRREEEELMDAELLGTAMSPEERAKMEIRLSQLRNETEHLMALREEMKSSKLVDLQRVSRRKRYAYNLRTVSDYVEIHRRAPSGEEEDGPSRTEALPARELHLALTEYHPFAMIMREEKKHVVTHVFADSMATARLHAKFGKFRTVCPNCGNLMAAEAVSCNNCGSGQVQPVNLIVPGRTMIMPAAQKLHSSPATGNVFATAQMLYRTADDQDKIEKTYPLRVEEAGAVSADVNRRTVYLTPAGLVESDQEPTSPIEAAFTFSDVELVTFVPAYSAVFEGGRREQVSLFRVCPQENCGGVVREGGQPFCSHDLSHDVSRARYVVPARQFVTRAVTIQVKGDSVQGQRLAHSLAHGLRLSLQQVAGVDLRTLGEIEKDGTYIVYEDVEGGYGITDLLLAKDDRGRFMNLEQALTLVRDHTSGSVCQCDDGCPFCLFQYGCTHRNRPHTLTRRGLHGLLDRQF